MYDLGVLSGGDRSVAQAISNTGLVVGNASTASGAQHAFLYTETDGMLDLNSLLISNPDNVTLTISWGVNDKGQIVANGSNGRGYLLNPVPVPAASWLLLSALSGIGCLRHKARKKEV